MKQQAKAPKKDKIIRLPISKFIDTGFRDYAIYVLENRGIPSFEDALTPVQRYILDSCPLGFTKTLSVVGKCIEAGYHHGNASIEKAISRLARPFANSLQIIEGYGFFGSEVSPEPAAARYTSVRLGKDSAEILRKYKHLFTKDEDGANHPFWLDVPIGLTIPIVGIAVGYKSTVLPRKLEEIREFLEGKRTSLKPHFEGFKGEIKKYNNSDKTWLVSSRIDVKDNKIEIRELPPIMKYSAALNKLDWLFSKYEGKVRLINNSNTKVNIDIVYLGRDHSEFNSIKDYIQKSFSVIVNESPVFIKDGQVLVYNKVEQYLEDYKWQLLKLRMSDSSYRRDWTSLELEFNIAKKNFIEFVLLKKRTVSELDEFLKPYVDNVKGRLESVTSKKFTKDELKGTEDRIKELTKELKEREKELKDAKKNLESSVDPTLARGVASKRNTTDLFDVEDLNEDNGIEVWNGDDVYEEEQIEKDIEENS